MRDGADESEDPAEKAAATAIGKIRKSLEFIKVTGESLLELAAGEDPDDAEEAEKPQQDGNGGAAIT